MIRTSPQTLPRLLAVLAAVLVTVPIAPVGAAAEPDKPTVTWSVQPADRNGPDGRRWIERTLDPGQVVTEHLAVRNFSDSAVVFSLKAADGYLTDKGRFNMLPSNQKSVDGGTWIKVQEKVPVGAKETKVVPFTITVPQDATPGDHPAGIAATVTSTGGTVAVESRVGFRVMMRASGTITPSVAISDLTASYTPSWNPFSGGNIKVSYTATNDGNVAVTGAGRVTVSELFGLTSKDAPAEVEEMLPGGDRAVSARVNGVWGLGRLRTTVSVTPAVLGSEPTDAEIRPASATVTTWTIPWAQLALLILLALLVLGVRFVIRQRRRRLAQLLADARAEGRAESQESPLVGGAPKSS
ncbi:WxL protein peptidoglycan domain-containing protein [Micromonospora sp. CA-263727]|uniref:WxL protein peptidoglycan domain-containing protein n=1 Tax=Micromonospora sp. CA-263727 TaxID=3239967 RepID=UPI003D94FFCE